LQPSLSFEADLHTFLDSGEPQKQGYKQKGWGYSQKLSSCGEDFEVAQHHSNPATTSPATSTVKGGCRDVLLQNHGRQLPPTAFQETNSYQAAVY